MIRYDVELQLNTGRVHRAIRGYGEAAELEAGRVAAEIMREGMRQVPQDAPGSPAGGFPYSRQGGIRNSISHARGARGVVVGPTARPLPRGVSISGASTLPELLNKGGVLTITRRDARGRPTTARIVYPPRPFVELTRQALIRRIPQILENTPLGN